MKSIIQENKECYKCGSTNWLEEHHIFGGANRKISERNGLKIYLCHTHHNEPPTGIHFNKEFMEQMHKTGQRIWQEKYSKTKEDFIREFGKNYL